MICFQIGKTKVELHFSFFAVFCLFFQWIGKEWGPNCLYAALIHEMGHLLAFAAIGSPPQSLHFQMNGIRLVPPEQPLSITEELFTLAGGSFSSLIVAALLWPFQPFTAVFHLYTGLFSMLPICGLDGGELLSLLLERFCPQNSRQIACWTSRIVSGTIAGWAIWVGYRTAAPGLWLLAAAMLLSMIGKQQS